MVGDISTRIGVEVGQRFDKQCSGCHAVHIVITVDGDGLMFLNGSLDAVNCFTHSCHLKWICVEVRFGVEICARLGIGGVAAVEKNLPKDGGNFESAESASGEMRGGMFQCLA